MQLAQKSGYGRSLFERLLKLRHDQPCHLLNVQYRMHPDVCMFPNRNFYSGLLRNGPNVMNATHRMSFQEKMYGPYAFLNVKNGIEEDCADYRTSKSNQMEVKVIVDLLLKLHCGEQDSFLQYPNAIDLWTCKSGGRGAVGGGWGTRVGQGREGEGGERREGGREEKEKFMYVPCT